MPEIQALTQSVHDLSEGVDLWNKWMLMGLALTVLAAVFVLAATRMVVFRSGQLSTVQEMLSAAKERQLQSELKAKDVEIGNLKLRSDTEEVGIAAAHTEAAEATAAQKRVETDLAKQQEKTATAERDLLQLQRRIEPRRISADQRTRLIVFLTGVLPKGKIDISCVLGDGEGQAFANDVDSVLRASGWETSGVSQAAYSGGNPVGFGIVVRSATGAPSFAAALQHAFFSIGLPLGGAENPRLPEGAVELLIGNKPN